MATPIQFDKLLTDGGIFDLDMSTLKVEQEGDFGLTEDEVRANLVDQMNPGCDGVLEDEDAYIQGQPFEILASKMVDLTQDGGVKKRVLREGFGATPADLAMVKIHYNAYVEYETLPFDSTYARKQATRLVVNGGQMITGLNIAIESMKMREKSQFLLDPEYAYGKSGCLGRIPADAQIFYEVELLDIIDSGATLTFNDLPPEDQKKFDEVHKYCLALNAKAKDMFQHGNIKGAIREYNSAVHRLEFAHLKDYNDEELQNQLLAKFYTNLVVCYAMDKEPKKSCWNYNQLNNLLKQNLEDMPVKALYHNAKSMRMLGELHKAKKQLEKARAKAPQNEDIGRELVSLQKEMSQKYEQEKKLAQKIIG